MANLNSVHLIGRLTRDPETRSFASGSSVAQIGFVVNNRRKNQDGTWGEEPVFIDCEAFGKTADIVAQYLRKGSQAFIEGHLKLDQWEDRNGGGKRSKLKVVVDNVQFLDQKRQEQRNEAPPDPPHYTPNDDPPPAPRSEGDIPFSWLIPLLMTCNLFL